MSAPRPLARRMSVVALLLAALPGLAACGGSDPTDRPDAQQTATRSGKNAKKTTTAAPVRTQSTSTEHGTSETSATATTSPTGDAPTIDDLDDIGQLIPPVGSTRQRLDWALTAWAEQRSTKPREFSVAVYDKRSGQTYLFNREERYLTASIIKTTITSALATKRVNDGEWLSSGERQLATASITVSDNGATSTLFNILGRPSGGIDFAAKLGLNETEVSRSWGKSTTSANDQVILMRDIAYGEIGVMPQQARDYVLGLMGDVIPEQRWGIGGELPDGVTFQNKNGWLPYGSGWIINSIGHVEGEGRDYVIAVLSEGQPDMDTGIFTNEGASSLVWQVLADPLSE